VTEYEDMQKMKRKRRVLVIVTASVAGALLILLQTATPAYSQDLTGRWVVVGEPLDNGEQLRSIVELKQSGNELNGSIKTPVFTAGLKGTAAGGHFKLFTQWDAKTPFLVGDLVNGELHGVKDGQRNVIAKPASPADEIPTVTYIEPPALHSVPDNGLAKTPPMGWNSWNLFKNKIDDPTVRAIADAMVSSGMRDAGYIYVNIEDTWEGVRDMQSS
jgi:alpha-galactosidase